MDMKKSNKTLINEYFTGRAIDLLDGNKIQNIKLIEKKSKYTLFDMELIDEETGYEHSEYIVIFKSTNDLIQFERGFDSKELNRLNTYPTTFVKQNETLHKIYL